MKVITLAAMLASVGGIAAAGIQVEFREGAPKDRFIVSNTGSCAIEDLSVTIDLAESSGNLIFDVTGSGAGVEVFQPFEIVRGAEQVRAIPTVADGQQAVTLELTVLEPGSQVEVTTDLDDTIGAREITVTGSEFSGTVLTADAAGTTDRAVFAGDIAEVLPGTC